MRLKLRANTHISGPMLDPQAELDYLAIVAELVEEVDAAERNAIDISALHRLRRWIARRGLVIGGTNLSQTCLCRTETKC
jgi:hypothetical protein